MTEQDLDEIKKIIFEAIEPIKIKLMEIEVRLSKIESDWEDIKDNLQFIKNRL